MLSRNRGSRRLRPGPYPDSRFHSVGLCRRGQVEPQFHGTRLGMTYRTSATSNQSDHASIFRKGFTDELRGPASPAIVNQLSDQDRAKPLPFEIGSNDDREFRGSVVRVRYRARHPERFGATIFALTDCDECHFPIVVNLREPRELRGSKLTHGHEDSIANIVRIKRVEELDVLGPVLRSDGAEQDLVALPTDPLLELLRIGTDRETILAIWTGR